MITLELNDAAVTGALDDLARQLADLTRPMQDIGDFLMTSTKARFGKGISPEGNAWAPKSETTKDAYRRRGYRVDDRPLFGPSGSLSGRINYQANARSVRVGSPMIYAATMQFGAMRGAFGAAMGRTRPSEKRLKSQDYFTPLPWGNIPARPFLGLSQTDRAGVLEIIAEHLAGAATP